MAGHLYLSIRRGAAAFLAVLLVAMGFAIGATPASAQNPVSIDITAGPDPVANGQQLTYTIVVTNTGGAKVTEVLLTDEVNGLTGIDTTNALVLTSDVGSCGQSGNIVTCTAPVLEGFQTWRVTIRGVVTAPNNTTLYNTATVTGTKSATTFTTKDTVGTQVTSGGNSGPLPDLVATVKGPVTTLPSHDTVYTVTVDNVGTVKASDVVLTVTLPSTVTYVTSTATSLFNCSIGGTTLTCTGGAVNAGTNATVQVGVVSPSFDTLVTISTTVDPFDAIPEANELNNANQATTQVGSTQTPGTLALEKTDASDPITPYETLTYTIKLTNTSSYRADYIEVVDGTTGLDAASVSVTSVVTGTSVPLTCTVAAPRVSCTTTRFQPGATATITIKGMVITSPGSVILNTATVNGNIRNTGHTNTASTITSVRPSVDLTVTQHRTFPTPPEPVRAADRFNYTITVGNSGLYNANNVLVREPLPDGVFLDGFTASPIEAGGATTCSADASQVVTCTIPQVRGANSSGSIGGDTEQITLELIAPQTKPSSPVSSAIGPITSTVTVDPINAIPENDESNNTYTTTTDVLTGVDLTVEKMDTPDPVARNGTLRYTITVTNNGTQDATGVVVRDVLPTGSVFRTATDTPSGPGANLHNFTCANSNGVVECVGGIIKGTYSGVGPAFPQALPTDFAVIVIDVFAPDEPGLYHNEIRVDPLNAIPEIDETDNLNFQDTTVINTHEDPATGSYGMYKELYISEITENPAETVPYATNAVLDYDITVVNAGQADAYNVVVKLTLPTGSRFRAANDLLGAGQDAFNCTESGGVVTCTGGTVQAGGTRGIRLQTFAPNDPGTALLRAMVDPSNAIGEADEANNTADETTVIQAGEAPAVQGTYIDLEPAEITDTPDPVGTSGVLTYTVPVENHGSADAFGVAFRATLPTGTRFISADDQGDPSTAFTCTESGGVVTCTGARINGGSARSVKIQVFAPEQPTTSNPASWAHFRVLVDPDNAIPEGHEGNNAAETFTQVKIDGAGGFVDLKVVKEAKVLDQGEAGAVVPGGRIEYTLKVANDGTDDAFNVKVRDPLPAGMTFVSATPDPTNSDPDDNFICQQADLVVECTGGYLKGTDSGGGERIIQVIAKAPLEHNRTIVNQVFVDPDNTVPEQSEVNNTASVSNQVMSDIDLTVDMKDAGIAQNTEGEWEFTVTKTGNGVARDVVVEANFSPGGFVVNAQAPATAVPAGWSCRVSENDVNKVVCIGDVTSNTPLSFKVLWHRSASTGGLESYADIDPTTGGYGAIVESNEDNNRDVGTNS